MPETMPSDPAVDSCILGPFLDSAVDRALGIGKDALLPPLIDLFPMLAKQFPYIVWQSADSMAVLLFIPKNDVEGGVPGLQVRPFQALDLRNPASELEPDKEKKTVLLLMQNRQNEAYLGFGEVVDVAGLTD